MILFVGVIILAAIVVQGVLGRFKIPALVGFLMLGFLARLLNDHTALLEPAGIRALDGLGVAGVTVLLFRVGLKSNARALVGQLRRASPIWLGNVFASAAAGYLAAAWLLGLNALGSAVVAIALTATSVGISAEIWNRAGKLDSPAGELFVDVAELDDISGVVAVALLFTVVAGPGSAGHDLFGAIAWPALVVLGKVAGFAALMFIFAHWLEPSVTRFFNNIGKPPHPMLLITATGLMMAGTAETLGLSVAIGAFFAGLAYSRDPGAIQYEKDFEVIYQLFVPFFFIHVGMQVAPEALGSAIVPGSILLAAGVLGKAAGNLVPGAMIADKPEAVLLTVSMLPRAEIALLVTQQAEAMNYISGEILSAMVLVSAATCLLAPWALEYLLRQKNK
ncbi:MAG TPA: cation:proton antiporter [Gammaproteobacteria bacterium]